MLLLPAALPSSRASSRGFAGAAGGADVDVDVDASDLDGAGADAGGPALQAQEASTPAMVQAETAATAVSFSALVSDMVLSTPLASDATETGTNPALATGST